MAHPGRQADTLMGGAVVRGRDLRLRLSRAVARVAPGLGAQTTLRSSRGHTPAR